VTHLSPAGRETGAPDAMERTDEDRAGPGLGVERPWSDDPRLQQLADVVDDVGWVAFLYDRDWHLIWASREAREMTGDHTPASLGYGLEVPLALRRLAWTRRMTEEERLAVSTVLLAEAESDVPGTIDAARATEPGLAAAAEAERRRRPDCGGSAFSFRTGYSPVNGPHTPFTGLVVRVRDDAGAFAAGLCIVMPALPMGLSAMLMHGDQEAFARMARLAAPGRRAAAVLFADLEGSGDIARGLSGAAYFRLISALTERIDRAVVRRSGIIGKHAGDGVTAFFVADDLGGPSGAARAAIEAARSIAATVRDIADDSTIDDEPTVRMNFGVHWGPGLYMGQLVTDGRLEVTALGDEVNECARIQQTAHGGTLLVSKALLERLDAADARALDLDPDTLHYTALGEMQEAHPKTVRDAGRVAVTRIAV